MLMLFVYGTLHDPAVQHQLIGRTIKGVPDQLVGYRRDNDLLPPYPIAMPDAGHVIDGYVLVITPDEISVLDDYEGSHYIRIEVQLESGLLAWVYRGNPAIYGA